MDRQYSIYDISFTLKPGMLAYPGTLPYHSELERNLRHGDSCNLTDLHLCAHTGTHVDAPAHYIPNAYGADQIPLENLYGHAYVADCCGHPCVDAELLEKQVPKKTSRLLLKTDNSLKLTENPDGPFNPDFVYLTQSGAQYIAEQNMLLVGIDYLTIDKKGLPEKPAHHILLARNITILEGILLGPIDPGHYFLACGPLKIADSDGSPCRTVLIKWTTPAPNRSKSKADHACNQ